MESIKRQQHRLIQLLARKSSISFEGGLRNECAELSVMLSRQLGVAA